MVKSALGFFYSLGLYAIPAGVWRGRQFKFTSEWIMEQVQIPVAEINAWPRSLIRLPTIQRHGVGWRLKPVCVIW